MKFLQAICGWLLLVIFTAGHAQQSQSNSTSFTNTNYGSVNTDLTKAGNWDLDETQWSKYKELLNSSAGLYYRHLHPVYVLGIHADSVSEQEKYAKQLYRIEKQRIDQLLSFNRAYAKHSAQDTALKINPDLVIERNLQLGFNQSPLSAGVSLAAVNDRFVVFVTRNCPACDNAVKRLVKANRKFEIYYHGADHSGEIRSWASSLNIPPTKVSSGDISLNFDNGFADQLGIVQFPIIYNNIKLDKTISLEDAEISVQ